MNKKLIALLLSACTAGAIQSHAQTAAAAPAPAPEPTWSLSLSPEYVSTYMFRGSRLDGAALQGAIDASIGNWDIGIWGSTPLKNKVVGQSDPELDPYGSYTWNLNDSVSVQPGFTVYTYVQAPTNQGFYHATFEPNIALNYTVGGLKLQPKLYDDVILHGPTAEFNAYYTVPLKSLSSELDFTGTIGSYYQSDVVDKSVPKTHTWGDYYLIGVSAPYQITKDLKANIGYAYTQGSSSYFKQAGSKRVKNTAAVGRGVLSFGVTWSF